MGTKKFRPVTPSLRGMAVSDFSEITKKTPEKSMHKEKSQLDIKVAETDKNTEKLISKEIN